MCDRAHASVFLPYDRSLAGQTVRPLPSVASKDLRRVLRDQKRKNASTRSTAVAMMIPGYGVAEQVFVGT